MDRIKYSNLEYVLRKGVHGDVRVCRINPSPTGKKKKRR